MMSESFLLESSHVSSDNLFRCALFAHEILDLMRCALLLDYHRTESLVVCDLSLSPLKYFSAM